MQGVYCVVKATNLVAVKCVLVIRHVFSVLLFCRLAAAKDEKGDVTAATAGAAAQNEGAGLDSGSCSGGGGGGCGGGIPTAGGGGEEQSEEKRKWEESRRQVAARATVPEFTEQTVDIIAEFVSDQSV